MIRESQRIPKGIKKPTPPPPPSRKCESSLIIMKADLSLWLIRRLQQFIYSLDLFKDLFKIGNYGFLIFHQPSVPCPQSFVLAPDNLPTFPAS